MAIERFRGTDHDSQPVLRQEGPRTTTDISSQREPRPIRIRPPFVRITRRPTPIEGPKPDGQS